VKKITAFFVITSIPISALAEGYRDDWWKYSYMPDWDTFFHMVAFVFWWLIAGAPALFGAFLVYLVLLAIFEGGK
jgi:hypothetical protein